MKLLASSDYVATGLTVSGGFVLNDAQTDWVSLTAWDHGIESGQVMSAGQEGIHLNEFFSAWVDTVKQNVTDQCLTHGLAH